MKTSRWDGASLGEALVEMLKVDLPIPDQAVVAPYSRGRMLRQWGAAVAVPTTSRRYFGDNRALFEQLGDSGATTG
jgi:hypothetical protein